MAAGVVTSTAALPQVTVLGTDEPSPDGTGIVYRRVITRYGGRREEWWIGAWTDHAGRIVRKRLAPTTEVRSARSAHSIAGNLAQAAWQTYQDELAQKDAASIDELEAMGERANFPREVVAREVSRICTSISAGLDSELDAGRDMFITRSTIPHREIYRILYDRSRFSISDSTVDLICCEFDMCLWEFVESAHQWSERRASWSRRPGLRDPWPYGRYYTTPTQRKSIVTYQEDDDFLAEEAMSL